MSHFDGVIKNTPLELLNEVETLMHVPQRAKYPPLTLVEVLCEFMKIKQGDKESLIDYLNRFKSEVEVVTRLFGKGITDGYAQSRQEYQDLPANELTAMAKLKSETWNEFVAILFLRNSNNARFGSMLVDFRKSFANNDDKYPKDLGSMVDVMRQQPSKNRQKTKPTPTSSDKEQDDTKGSMSFAQTDG